MATQFKKTATVGEFEVVVDGVCVGRVRRAIEYKVKVGVGNKAVGRTEKVVWKAVRPDLSVMLGSSTSREDAVKRLTGERL